jgi:hypothetical protein
MKRGLDNILFFSVSPVNSVDVPDNNELDVDDILSLKLLVVVDKEEGVEKPSDEEPDVDPDPNPKPELELELELPDPNPKDDKVVLII